MLLTVFIVASVVLLLINMLTPRVPYRFDKYEHDNRWGNFVSPEFIHDMRSRAQMNALINALIFVTLIILFFIVFEDKKNLSVKSDYKEPTERNYEATESEFASY